MSCSWSISPTPSSLTSGAANEWILHQSLNRPRARPGCHPSKALTTLMPSPALSPHRTLWFSWTQPGASPHPWRSRKSQLGPGGFPLCLLSGVQPREISDIHCKPKASIRNSINFLHSRRDYKHLKQGPFAFASHLISRGGESSECPRRRPSRKLLL